MKKGRRLKTILKRLVVTALAIVASAALAVFLVLWTGLADRWMRSAVIGEIEKMTGGRVELENFHFDPWHLRVELGNLTIHGSEPSGTPPFFHADSIFINLRGEAFWRRKISLRDLRMERPMVHVRFDAGGRSNVPAPQPRTNPGKPFRERLFELAIGHVQLDDGQIVYNDVRVPLVAQGGAFHFTMDYALAGGKPVYLGQLSWQQMTVVARRYLPFPSDLAVKFALERERLEITQVQWKIPNSDFDAQATLTSFTNPVWDFRFRGRLSLEDVRVILRKPRSPRGRVDFSGQGRYAEKRLALRGKYVAQEIAMNYDWYHAAGMTSRGSYVADRDKLDVPDFEASVLGGEMRGRLHLDFHGMKFRVESHAQNMNLAALLRAVDRRSFPVATLHWAGSAQLDAVTTFVKDFQHVESTGVSVWTPAAQPAPGEVPASAHFDYHYVMDREAVELKPSTITTPSSVLRVRGLVAKRGSSLEAYFDTTDLLSWNDLINTLRGAGPQGAAEPKRIAGRAHWEGRMTGALDGPTFTGHGTAYRASYGNLYLEEVGGDIVYSPDEFRLQRGRAVMGARAAAQPQGRSSAAVELSLELNNWSFEQENKWSLDANLIRASTDDLQELFGWHYPAHGLLSGQFRGSGTRAAPEISGLFDVAEVDAWGYHLDRFRGQLHLSPEEVRIVNAELRLPVAYASGRVPGRNNAAAAPPVGVITGNFAYRLADGQVAFELTGAAIRLDAIERIQTTALPLGGQLHFQISGKGPLLAPVSQGSLRVVDLRVGSEVLGSFEGKLNSDGRQVRLDINSAMSTGSLQGKLALTLGGDYPIQGELTLQAIDLDPFIQTALRLRALTGHSSVDGHFRVAGALLKPGMLEVDAEISRVTFNYEYVKLENDGPIKLSYRRDEVRIEQAHLRGADTDFRVSGFARFTGDRRLGLNVAGTVNLRLLSGLAPQLEARGPAQINVAIEGTYSKPRITGRAHVEDAAATYGEFPAGLSHVKGDFVFDSSRLLLENVTAETGGGVLNLSGSLTYGDGPLRYDLTASASRVRIRYPEGMSWLTGGTLRLSGTAQAALLSGRVVVERLLMAQGFDLAALIVASKEPVRAPTTNSPFLRNLQFDIEAVSSPDARMEWTGAHVDTEASLRVRGTWEHPILLGHIHLLGGEMSFRGNRYRLTRGDLNFSNPFRLDPVLNVEAVTTIRQYEVTLNFSGPASKLTLAYRSDPPLPSSDIIALLALGRTGEESELRSPTAVQTPELGATTLLTEAISSQLGGRIERLFGISRFRVDPFLAGTGTEQNAAARVTIEQQVTRDLVITYITNVTSTQQQVIQIEYNVSRSISIVALRDQNGTFGLDVKFKKRFK